jgi:hypothetical protein
VTQGFGAQDLAEGEDTNLKWLSLEQPLKNCITFARIRQHTYIAY